VIFTELATESEPTAITEMDDKCVVFTENRTVILSGDAPNALGAGATLSVPQTIPADVGSMTPHIATIPQGLLFQSKKGIWQLDRGLNASYIGSSVEEPLNGLLITSALPIPQDNKVIFTSGGGSFVYDTFFGLWSTYTPAAQAACIRQGNHCILRPNGSVWQLGTSFGDDSAPYETVLETGWISFAGIMGFQRLYNLCFLGTRQGSGAVFVVELFYDFGQKVTDTFTFTLDDLVSGNYGDDDYGDESPYGGAEDGVLRLKLKPSRQKCSSVKIRISDSFPNSEQSAGFKLTALQAEVGVISGRGRQGRGRNMIAR
jgi:hypothetical protein